VAILHTIEYRPLAHLAVHDKGFDDTLGLIEAPAVAREKCVVAARHQLVE
jgi:hypothetical protein